MKKLLLILLLGVPLASCDLKGDEFLAPQNTTAITEEMVFTDSIRTTQFLTRMYSDLGMEFDYGAWDSHGNILGATDDLEYTLASPTNVVVIHSGGTHGPMSYTLNGIISSFWRVPYENIRRASLLMANIDRAPLSAATKRRMIGEARFLRAWYYSYLVKRYGGVPIINNQLFTPDDIVNRPRNTYEECVNYMVSELDEAANMLDQVLPEQFYGRANKGACLALKSRVLLYAASPLFNGGAITEDPRLRPLVSYPTYDVSRWKRAADAAQNLIDQNWYQLYVDNTTAPGYGFYQLFLQRVNPEFIFTRLRPNNRDVEGYFFPQSRGGARYMQPTQNFVDAFPMLNGKLISDPASGYNEANPYVNRDPRFGYSVIYNESRVFFGSSSSMQPVYTFDRIDQWNTTQPVANRLLAQDQFPTGTITGYFNRKMAEVNSNAQTERGQPLIRFAEILLNYAEAINETGQTELAVPKLIQIRERAGIEAGADGRYGIPTGLSVAEMRELIHNERRIELAFEGPHRYFDMRRWKKMPEGQRQNQVMRIVRNADGTYTYNRQPAAAVQTFRPAHYLYPIPQIEINKMPLMLQNPGY